MPIFTKKSNQIKEVPKSNCYVLKEGEPKKLKQCFVLKEGGWKEVWPDPTIDRYQPDVVGPLKHFPTLRPRRWYDGYDVYGDYVADRSVMGIMVSKDEYTLAANRAGFRSDIRSKSIIIGTPGFAYDVVYDIYSGAGKYQYKSGTRRIPQTPIETMVDRYVARYNDPSWYQYYLDYADRVEQEVFTFSEGYRLTKEQWLQLSVVHMYFNHTSYSGYKDDFGDFSIIEKRSDFQQIKNYVHEVIRRLNARLGLDLTTVLPWEMSNAERLRRYGYFNSIGKRYPGVIGFLLGKGGYIRRSLHGRRGNLSWTGGSLWGGSAMAVVFPESVVGKRYSTIKSVHISWFMHGGGTRSFETISITTWQRLVSQGVTAAVYTNPYGKVTVAPKTRGEYGEWIEVNIPPGEDMMIVIANHKDSNPGDANDWHYFRLNQVIYE